MQNIAGLKKTIIIPCYNEELNIAACLKEVLFYNVDCEILVVDGGSDATEQIVKEYQKENPNLKYIKNINDQGKGHAIRTGIVNATGELIAQIDCDLQFLPEDLNQLFTYLSDNPIDLVVGSRFLEDSIRVEGSTPFLRKLGNYFFSFYLSLLTGQKHTDVLSGIKAWKRKVTETFALESDNYSYELELILKSIHYGFQVRDLPITTKPRFAGFSTVNVIKTAIDLIKDITSIKLRLHIKS
jgi:glycosyltransferase involved in cell wall biosynthesis